MIRRPPRSTRTDTLFPYTTLFRSLNNTMPNFQVSSPYGQQQPNFSVRGVGVGTEFNARSEEHTSELQSLMRISYAVFCLKKKTNYYNHHSKNDHTQQPTITHHKHTHPRLRIDNTTHLQHTRI